MKLLCATIYFLLSSAQVFPLDTDFTDSDDLKPRREDVRGYLDKALKEKDPELVASIPIVEMLGATPKEIADLINITTKKGMGKLQVQWLTTISGNKNIKVPQALSLLAQQGELSPVIKQLSTKQRQAFVGAAQERFTPLIFANIMIPLIIEDSKDSKLMAYQLMDRARKLGVDKEIRKELARYQTANGHIGNFIQAAYPERLPILIAHRGGNSKEQPENTLELVQETLKDGYADGIEIDISMTKDNVPILWHDENRSDLVAGLRAAGFESGSHTVDATPDCPESVSDVSFKKIRALYGYVSKITGKRAKAPVPTMESIFVEVKKTRPDLKVITLDIKTPAKYKEKLISLAEQIYSFTKKYGFEGRVVVLHTEEEGAKIFSDRSRGVYAVSYDIEIVNPLKNLDNLRDVAEKAHKAGRTHASIGRPLISAAGWSGYLELVRANVSCIKSNGTNQKFMVWTINDEVEFREIIGTGVEYVLTDNLAGLSKVLQEYKTNAK